MHEFSTVKNIVERVTELAESEKANMITKIEISLGEFTLLEEEQMKFWLGLMLSETELGKNTEVILRKIEGKIECNECGYTGSLNTTGLDHLFPILKCPQCESHDLEVMEGNDCIIESMEIDR